MASPTAPHHPESVFATEAAAVAAKYNNHGLLGCRNVSWSLPKTRSAAFLSSQSSTSTSMSTSSGGSEAAAAAALLARPPIDRPESVPPPERTVSGYCRFLFGAADVVVDAGGDEGRADGNNDSGTRARARAAAGQHKQQQQPSPSAAPAPTSIPLPLPIITNNNNNKSMAASATIITSMKRARSLGLGGRIPSVDLTAVAAAGLLDAADDAPAAPNPPTPQTYAPLPLPLPLPITPPSSSSQFAKTTPPRAPPPAKVAKCFNDDDAIATATTPPPPPPCFSCPPPPPRTTRARSAAASRTAPRFLGGAAEIAEALPNMPKEALLSCGAVARLEARLWRVDAGREPSSSSSSPSSSSPSRVVACVSVSVTAASPFCAPCPPPLPPPFSSMKSSHDPEESTFRLAMAIQASSSPRVVTTGLPLASSAEAAAAAAAAKRRRLAAAAAAAMTAGGGAAAARQTFPSSGRPGSAPGLSSGRLQGVHVLELLFVKKRTGGGDADGDGDEDEDDGEEQEDGADPLWHLPGQLDASRPLPQAPASFSRCFSKVVRRSRDDEMIVVDVAARVSDGAGGDLWLRASGRPLLVAAAEE